ncbi:ctr copper transporter family protein [Klebsormidium nitens]|uniref:Copper transport protein n=1 Tax=Klebsormidium nitens TaxID=105231 RepID=A0A1Y1IQ97_KLENI|nr:ctr copper transporter family protein [Klebsormidium nitens]|eukprot:GAQ90797.1 ctr copper transporter family protein [Klebsormidium nitens]
MEGAGEAAVATAAQAMPHAMHMMHSFFYWGPEVTLLFQPWMIMSWPKYYVALVGVFLFCVLHEWFTTYRTSLDAELRGRSKSGADESLDFHLLPSGEGSSQRRDQETDLQPTSSRKPKTWPGTAAPRFLLSFLYAVNLGSSYLIMLIVMTFNGGLFLAVLAGLGVGYGAFGYHRGSSKQSSDLCHVT